MVFVCLSHFATGYFASIGHPERQDLTDRISMLASPSFMLISGSMLGLLASTRSVERFARVREKLDGPRTLSPRRCARADRDRASAAARWAARMDAVGIHHGHDRRMPVRGSDRSCADARRARASPLRARCTPRAGGSCAHGIRRCSSMRFIKDTIVGPMGTSTRLYNFPIFRGSRCTSPALRSAARMAKRRARGESSVRLVLGIGGVSIAVTLACVGSHLRDDFRTL